MTKYRVLCAKDGLFYPQHCYRRDLLDIVFFRPKWVFLSKYAVEWATKSWPFIYEKDPMNMARFSTLEEAENFLVCFDHGLLVGKERREDKYLRILRGVK